MALCPEDLARSSTSRHKCHLTHINAHQLGKKGLGSDLQAEKKENDEMEKTDVIVGEEQKNYGL